MIPGIDINKKIELISKTDVNEPKTVFVIKPFSGIDKIELNSKGIAEILDKAIVEIRNKPEGISKLDFIKSIDSPDVIGELLEQITIINNITKEEAKN
jgi:ABC-type uncharacterized transport system ATPase subunit